uniref:Sushi domain-containing protein n=1 Tax=Megaselia scalaris TaxID=36166 RepID=T1GXK3_MEGSC
MQSEISTVCNLHSMVTCEDKCQWSGKIPECVCKFHKKYILKILNVDCGEQCGKFLRNGKWSGDEPRCEKVCEILRTALVLERE